MTTTSKAWRRDLPFTRINSPSETRPPALRNTAPPYQPLERLDGNGHARGTRRQDDFHANNGVDSLVTSRLIALTPSWTATLDDAEHELQGTLVRSFQTWTDAPPLQWHRYYDWNFHVEPEREYDWLRGAANGTAETGTFIYVDKTTVVSDIPIIGPIVDHFNKKLSQRSVPGHAMECEWDTGSFGAPSSPRPGPMFDADWAWPMANWRVWLCGRSIYDGGHETHAQPPLCRSELHPVKAVACARWEAFAFKENNDGKENGEIHTPAIQFMFFTSKYGGYSDHPDVRPKNGAPYEFIVDLPEAMIASAAHPIGHTPDFPINTVMVRKLELVQHFERARFRNAKALVPAADVDPDVTLLPPGDDPAKRQAKITIPMSALTGDYYGVIVSLGWRDPSGEQAAKVKKVTVVFKNLFKASINHDTFAEEWRFKAGVNGRWFQWEFLGVHNRSNHPLETDQKGRSTKVVLYLHEDDSVQFSSHGAELDLVDDVYEGPDVARTVSVDVSDVQWEAVRATTQPQPELAGVGARSGPIDWFSQVDIKGFRADQAFPVQRAIARKIRNMMWTTFNDQNDPLGLIDARVNQPNRERDMNPFFIKKWVGKGERPIALCGYETYEEGDSAELLERPHTTDEEASNEDWLDYRLEIGVTVEEQKH